MVSQRSAGKRRTVTSSRLNGRRKNGTGDVGSSDALLDGLSAPPGEHLFDILVRSLAMTLGTRIGFVSKIAEEPKAFELLAIWTGEDFGECITYPVKGTPCERVLGKNIVTIPKGVQKEYPKDVWLAEIGAESYIAVPLLSSEGRPIGHVGVIHDAPLEASEESVAVLRAFAVRAAGELQRNIEQREASQRSDRVEAILAKAPIGILQVDENGTIVFVNPRVETLFGYQRNELLGRPVEVLVPGRLRGRHKEDRTLFMRDPHDRPMGAALEISGRRKEGSTVPLTIALAGVDGTGIAFISDATKSRQATTELQEKHTRLEAVIQALPELTFVLDGNGVYIDFVSSDGINPYVSPDKFLGKCMKDVLPEDVAEPAMARIKLAIETDRVQRLKYKLNMPDGQHSFEGRFIRLDSNRVVLFVRDLMAEQRLMREGNHWEAGASQADEVERRMEWRNPYGLSYREFTVLHLLKGGTTDKEIADDLGISVFTVNKHVSNILTKMNAASRTEATIRALQEGLID